MKRFLFFTYISILSINIFAQPTNNPYKDKYPANSHWTDELPWNNVHNINNFSGANWDEKLANAQDYVAAIGGGVVYFPAGTYTFTDDITIKQNVIIRGEMPDCIDAVNDSFAPPTRWEFPQYIPSFTGAGTPKTSAFKKIRSEYAYLGTLDERPSVRNHSTGLVYIDINRAFIVFHPSVYNQAQPGGGVKYRPAYMDRVILFGIRNNNAALAYPFVPVSYGWQHEWQRWSTQGIANIDALVDEKLVICNNRLNDYENNSIYPRTDDSFEQPGYIIATDDTLQGFEARFEYNDHYGIIANRFINFFEITEEGNNYSGDIVLLSGLNVEPDDEPYLFAREVEINDNWLYQTKRVAMFVSGLGMEVKNNVIRDQKNKIRYVGSGGATVIDANAYFENRGIDFSGWDVTIEGNDVEVYNTKTGYSGYSTNDGEGIMIQECCGGASNRNYIIRKNKLSGPNAYIGLYKTRNINNVLIDSNNLGGKNIYVNANTNSSNYMLHKVTIENNYNISNIIARGDAGGDSCFVRNNKGSGYIDASCYVVVENNDTLTENTCISAPTIKQTNFFITNPSFDYSETTDSIITISGYYDNTNGAKDIILWDNLIPVDTINSSGILDFEYKFIDNSSHIFRLGLIGNSYFSNSIEIKYTGEIDIYASIEYYKINYTNTPPIIDGIMDLIWDETEGKDLKNILLGSADDVSGSFKALWNNNSLYLIVIINDDVKSITGQYTWDKDQIEVYLDLNNNKSLTYDSNDFKFEYSYEGLLTESKQNKTAGVVYSKADTDSGYIMEIKFPFSSLDTGTIYEGKEIGLDVHCIDNDDSTTRESKIAWFATSDNSWSIPATFGTGIFSSQIVSTGLLKLSENSISYYPNPFSDFATIEIPTNLLNTKIIVTNSEGKIIESKVTDKNKIEIGRNYLPGVYIVSFGINNRNSILLVKE